MERRLLLLALLLIAGIGRLQAQDIPPATALDGPVLKTDSLTKILPKTLPPMAAPVFAPIQLPEILNPFPDAFETKEQRAARLNAQARTGLMNSIDYDLAWYKPPKLSPAVKNLLSVLKLFLVSPFKFQDGYVPVMNASNPFMALKTPGWAPEANPYSAESFPPCIKLEFDVATGTYKQVMVDWKQYEKDFNKAFNKPLYNTDPIPQVPLSPGDRIVGH